MGDDFGYKMVLSRREAIKKMEQAASHIDQAALMLAQVMTAYENGQAPNHMQAVDLVGSVLMQARAFLDDVLRSPEV